MLRHSRTAALVATIASMAWLSSLTAEGLRIAPTPAAAQWFNPCMTPQGYLIICCPKPCPIVDPQKIATEATKLQQEVSKLTSLVSQLQQWKSMLQSVASNPLALLSMIGGANGAGLNAFKNIPAPTAGGALPGADFSTIGGSKNAIAQLFFQPNGDALKQQQAVADAKTTALATGIHARAAMQPTMDQVEAIASDAKKTKTVRDDMAIANRIRIAMLQSLQNQNVASGTLLEMLGATAALAVGPDSGSNGYSNGSTPYAPQIAPTVAAPSTQAATDLAAAQVAMQRAVDLHNAAAAGVEMSLASGDAASIAKEQATVDGLAAQAHQALSSILASLYADPSSAASAILKAAAQGVTATWPDTETRTAQETSGASATAATVAATPAVYGAAVCQTTDCAPDPTALATAIYAAVDSAQQAAWYATLTSNAADLQNTLAQETSGLSQWLGVDVRDQAAVTQAIASATSDANAALARLAADGASDDQQNRANQIAATLAAVAADPGLTLYIAYDPTQPPTPTALAAAQ